ncbi:MAG: MFS transporter [Spirochaetia bacterium]|nr:MFS transporter [Spirochaetia bacterium]
MRPRYLPTFNRHLGLLLVAQSLAGSTSAVSFLVSGFIGTTLAPVRALATLPMSTFVIGVAISSTLAAWTMSRIGRKKGHLLGLSIAVVGSAMAGTSLFLHSFAGYSISCSLLGIGTAFTNQIRFTAAEAAPPEEKALVHSSILMCGLFAAVLGPGIAALGKNMVVDPNDGMPLDYIGSYVLLAGILILATTALSFLPRSSRLVTQAVDSEKKGRLMRVLARPEFWLAGASGTASFAVMTLLMSATPMQMTEIEHFSHHDAIFTIQSHIIAMFLPSLFSGILIARLGLFKLILAGLVLFAACVPVAYFAGTLHGYWWALVLLGVGWNFLFLAGSTMLSLCFSGSDRFAAQGLNDTMVFGTQAIASLAAGWMLYTFGWQALSLFPIPFLVLVLVLSTLQRGRLGAAQGSLP